MDAQKYLKIAIAGVICIVVLVVGYGIYINDASRRHIEKMEAAQYTVLPVAQAGYRDIHALVENVSFTVRAPWTIDIAAQYEGVLDEIRVKKSIQRNNDRFSHRTYASLPLGCLSFG